MFQAKQIGKYRSKKTQAECLLNRICVTPNGEKYSLVSIERIGKSNHYVYEWLDCPTNIQNSFSTRLRSKTLLGVEEIINWISYLKSL